MTNFRQPRSKLRMVPVAHGGRLRAPVGRGNTLSCNLFVHDAGHPFINDGRELAPSTSLPCFGHVRGGFVTTSFAHAIARGPQLPSDCLVEGQAPEEGLADPDRRAMRTRMAGSESTPASTQVTSLMAMAAPKEFSARFDDVYSEM